MTVTSLKTTVILTTCFVFWVMDDQIHQPWNFLYKEIFLTFQKKSCHYKERNKLCSKYLRRTYICVFEQHKLQLSLYQLCQGHVQWL